MDCNLPIEVHGMTLAQIHAKIGADGPQGNRSIKAGHCPGGSIYARKIDHKFSLPTTVNLPKPKLYPTLWEEKADPLEPIPVEASVEPIPAEAHQRTRS